MAKKSKGESSDNDFKKNDVAPDGKSPKDVKAAPEGSTVSEDKSSQNEPASSSKQGNESEKAAKSSNSASEASAKLEAELAAEKDKYLRLLAEYDNFRKRSLREREALFSDIKSETILKILPVYDNLARALKQNTIDAAFYKGVEMTMNQLVDILKKLGVTEIPALGEKFDPACHNAVMHIKDDQYGENEIVEEFEKGFMLGDKVIRFSMVKVAN